MRTVVHSLQRRGNTGARPNAASHATLANPADAWAEAALVFRNATGKHPGQFLAQELARRGDVTTGVAGPWPAKKPLYAWLYRALRASEAPRWEAETARRIANFSKGSPSWEGTSAVRRLKALPRSIPQTQRWTLFKLHFKGIPTTRKVSHAHTTTAVVPCVFCQQGTDTDNVAHIVECQRVNAAFKTLRARHDPSMSGWNIKNLLFQITTDGSVLQLMMASLHALWVLRRLALRGFALGSDECLVSHLLRFVECPWLLGTVPERSRKERRETRIKPPPLVPIGCVKYRSDGASRRQGLGGAGEASWGAGRWEDRDAVEPTATARGYLGEGVTNNVAEYVGVQACFENAVGFARTARLARPPKPPPQDFAFVFEVDSSLVAQQINGHWGCNNTSLQGHYAACIRAGRTLREWGWKWMLRHIYREFNATADGLANQALDDSNPRALVRSANW